MNVRKFGQPKRKVKKEKELRKRKVVILLIHLDIRNISLNGDKSSLMKKLELLLLDVHQNLKKVQRKNLRSSLKELFISHFQIIQQED
jgi:hypothetical protein